MVSSIRNRIYSALGELLNLEGTQSVKHVDLSQVVLTQDLSTVAEESQVAWWEMQYERTTAGIEDVSVNLDPFIGGNASSFANTMRNGVSLGAFTSEGPVPRDEVFFLTRLSVRADSDPANFTSAFLFLVPGPGSALLQPRHPLTSVLNRNASAGSFVPAVGDPYYLQNLPMRFDARSTKFITPGTVNVRLISSGVCEISVAVSGFSAPPGIIGARF